MNNLPSLPLTSSSSTLIGQLLLYELSDWTNPHFTSSLLPLRQIFVVSDPYHPVTGRGSISFRYRTTLPPTPLFSNYHYTTPCLLAQLLLLLLQLPHSSQLPNSFPPCDLKKRPCASKSRPRPLILRWWFSYQRHHLLRPGPPSYYPFLRQNPV